MAERKTIHDWAETGIMIGLGLLLVWDISSTNDNTKAIGEIKKDVASNKTEHISEVNRSTDKDNDQEEDISNNTYKLYGFNRELGQLRSDVNHLLRNK